MTLILALGNRDYMVQLSHRRLTSHVGVVTEEFGKAGTLVCDDARLVYGFTGLTTAGPFSTQQWLVEALCKGGAPDFSAEGGMHRLRELLTTEFATNPNLRPLPRASLRLTVMFSGFLYRENPPLIVQCLLTNFQDFHRGTGGYDAAEAWNQLRAAVPQGPAAGGRGTDDYSAHWCLASPH